MRLRFPSPAKSVLILSLLLIIAAVGSIFYAVKQIANPPRRPLMDYHREILGSPADHGMIIQSFTATDPEKPKRSVPTLVCSPDPGGKIGKRGIILRDQIAARGVPPEPPGKIIGNLVLLHGRIGRKEDWLPVAERFCAAGFRCILPDLAAHGESPERYSTYGIRDSYIPQLALEAAARQFQFDPQPAGIIGRSMGGSFAIHSAGLHNSPWRSIAIICSFDDFQPVIERQASHYVTPLLSGAWTSAIGFQYRQLTGIPLEAIRPAGLAARIHIPALVAHGTDDSTIPLASGRRLFDAFASSEKRFIEIPGADHDNVLVTDYPVYADIAEWMIRHVR